MKKGCKHLAVCVGDHSGRTRDIAPNKTPLTIFLENGEVCWVSDIDTRMIRAVRRLARRDGISVNRLLSGALVEGIMEWLEGWEGA